MIQTHLYKSSTVIEVLDRYIEDLTKQGTIDALIHANKLKSYKNMINNKEFLRNSRKLFNEIYDLLNKKHPSLHFSIAGRIKSLISSEKKILQSFVSGQSLDQIKDFMAFRLILFSSEEIDLIKHCYRVMEEIIDLAVKLGYTPCDRQRLLEVPDVKEHKNSYFSKFKYKGFVKDYICFPKENGYQSMHLVLVDTKGRHIEIQIRTFSMHAQIESGDANHAAYKDKKYNIEFPLDREKINVSGYTYMNETLFDYAGIEQPIVVFQRQKTF